MLIYSLATSLNHKAMINGYNGWWHGLSAAIDIFVVLVFALFLEYNWFFLGHWTNLLLILCMFALIRDVIRSIILGIGTTARLDIYVNGFWRACLWGLLAFFTFCYLHWYWVFAYQEIRMTVYGNFIELFR